MPSSRLVESMLAGALGLLGSVPAQIELFEARKQTTPPLRVAQQQAVVADFDGDRRPDLFFGIQQGWPRLYLQMSAGRFTEASHRIPSRDGYRVVTAAAGDLDGDGDQDVLAFSNQGGGANQCWMLRNEGGPFTLFAPAVTLPSFANLEDLVLGDLDGDGDLDAVVATRSWAGAPNLLLVNDGRGGFTAGGGLPADLDPSTSLALGDVDGDGDLDLLVGNMPPDATAYPNRLYRNDGRGSFTDASGNLPAFPDNTEGVALADLDRDGDLDAVIANRDLFAPSPAGRSRVLLNDGRGLFTEATATHLPVDPEGAMAVAVADVDGDGHRDVVFGGVSVAGLLYRNDGTGRLAPAPAGRLDRTGLRGERIHAGDLDGNGTVDLVVSGWQLQVFFHLGRGEFVDATGELRSPPQLGWIYNATVFDADGDGSPDRLDHWGLALNRGDGILDRIGSRLMLSENHYAWNAAGDVDGDGDLDAVWYGMLPHLLLNDGTGNLVETAGRLPTLQPRFPGPVVLADVDRDGDRDLLLGAWASSLGPGQTELLLNDGTGRFTDATANLPANPGDVTNAIAVFDIENDGDLDVLLGNGGVGPPLPDRLLRNDGSGRFADVSTQLPPVTEYTYSISTADVDADGDLDVFLAMMPPVFISPQVHNRLYLNDGRGNFSDVSVQRLPQPALYTHAPASTFADLDADGDADLGLGEWLTLVVCANDGQGVFATAVPPLTLDCGASMTATDVDGDGDLDLLGSRIVMNGRRHLHALDVARLGGTLRLQARHRAAGASFPLLPFVAASRLPRPRPLGTLGLLFLDPSSIVALPPATIATLHTIDIALPNAVHLAGLILHAQAAFLPPNSADWHLSGLVSEPILR